MKILLTIYDISVVGGTERVVCNLANAFCKMGHKVSVLSLYKANPSIPFEFDQDVKLHFKHLDSEKNISLGGGGIYHSSLSKLYNKHMSKFLLSFWVWRHFKGNDLVLVNDSYYIPYFKHHSTKYIRLIHQYFTYRKRNRAFDAIAILSRAQLDLWKCSYKNKEILVIPNFVPEIPQQNAQYASKIVLSVGRMDVGDEKGFLRLLEVWKQVMEDGVLMGWKLLIVGSGVIQQDIESKIKALGLNECVVLKPFTQAIIQEYLASSIYVMSSYHEGLPMVLLESGACGLPAIAFDVMTGPSDIIEDGVSGYLVKDNDLQGFANKLKMLMEDENLRIEMGKHAKQRIQNHFSSQAVLAMWENVMRGSKRG